MFDGHFYYKGIGRKRDITCCGTAVADGVHVFPEQEIVIEAEEDSVDELADEQAQRCV